MCHQELAKIMKVPFVTGIALHGIKVSLQAHVLPVLIPTPHTSELTFLTVLQYQPHLKKKRKEVKKKQYSGFGNDSESLC